MTFHKNFFHDAIKEIRNRGYEKMIVVGGPHPTTSYQEVLEDKNIDVCVIGEGEATLAEIVDRLIKNEKKCLTYDDLNKIDGIAFNKTKFLEKFSNKTKFLEKSA